MRITLFMLCLSVACASTKNQEVRNDGMPIEQELPSCNAELVAEFEAVLAADFTPGPYTCVGREGKFGRCAIGSIATRAEDIDCVYHTQVKAADRKPKKLYVAVRGTDFYEHITKWNPEVLVSNGEVIYCTPVWFGHETISTSGLYECQTSNLVFDGQKAIQILVGKYTTTSESGSNVSRKFVRLRMIDESEKPLAHPENVTIASCENCFSADWASDTDWKEADVWQIEEPFLPLP